MRYWVYINGKVIEMPFEEGELSAIKGFNADTLVCKETPAAGETQEWMPAKMLIEAYKQPAPPPPPSRQIIEKFSPSSQNTVLKEPKGTILSSNIFGSTEKKEPEPQQNNTDAMFSQTEAIFPEEIEQENKELSEQEKLKKEIFSEPPTEVVSFDAVEEFDVDKHSDNSTESEEEILKTAIRTSISSKNIKKANTSVQAIDIINNNNIDISDEQEDEVKAENSEEKSAEKSEENAPKEEVDSQKDLSQTELTPLGDSEKKPLTRLFDSEPVVQEPAPTPQEQPVKEEQPIKEEIQEQNENPEDEFVPEEEISLGDEDLLIEDIKEEAPVLENNEPAPKEVQEVLQEFVKENQTQEKGKFEDTLKTSPALVADLAAEMPSNEFLPKQENNILDIQNQPDNIDEHPTTLEELTGRYPIEEEASSSKEQPAKEEQKTAPQEQENNISQEQQEEGIVIPAEIHPDVIVEEVKEEEPVKVEENIPSPETQTIADKDNFLNTFSSDIETVFLLPGAIVLKKIGLLALFEGMVFLFILILGYIYLFKKGAFVWSYENNN